MPDTDVRDIIVNKISKSLYDQYVLSGDIDDSMIENELWIFTDDQYVTPANITKLAGIEAGAQVNIIEGVKVNGITLNPNAKIVNIVVPTKLSDLENDLVEEKYWQARTGRALNNSDCIFLNVNKTDFTDVPLGNIVQFNNCSGSVFYLKFIQEGTTYKLVKANSSGQYDSAGVMAHGSLTNMIWDHSYVIFPYNLVNYYSKVTILISDLSIIDNLFRINNFAF